LSTQALDNPQQSGEISHDEVTVAVSEDSLLVPLAKSKKLAALRQQSQVHQTIKKNPVPSAEILSSGLNKEVILLLKATQEQINAKTDEIMASYPPGKKNKMFTLRYGSPESIKQMAMKAIFNHLGLVKHRKFALIENLDYFGNDTQSKKTGPSR
jgi:ABC-type Fe2+-enterobactin transport system substrate-binding protein